MNVTPPQPLDPLPGVSDLDVELFKQAQERAQEVTFFI